MPLALPARPRSTLLGILALWFIFYASFTLFSPPLLDDADSVHAEVAREMLLRHDYVTLYANGIRYLEKAPLLYWSMAACMRLSQLFGHTSARDLAAVARLPLALTVLALALLAESFARRIYRSARAGLYAALILLSSPGLFLFTRILIPDAMLCLFLTLALYAFYLTEEFPPEPAEEAVILTLSEVKGKNPRISPDQPQTGVPHPPDGFIVAKVGIARKRDRLPCYLFAAACALAVLTKGLIGLLFPLTIVLTYLLLTRSPRAAFTRIRQLHPLSSLAVFLAIAAPWHILIALANPTQGHPAAIAFHAGRWQVPFPTQGNVHGWLWFYFINEHLLRYLNLRVPRDYDTVPLWLFWSLCLIWLMPFSAFVFKALGRLAPGFAEIRRQWSLGKIGRITFRTLGCCYFIQLRGPVLLTAWAAFPLLFFSLSTRQEYYVLPSFPAAAILIAGWLAQDARVAWHPITKTAIKVRRANLRITAALLALGTLFVAASLVFLLHTHAALPTTDLAALLQQHPSDYALSLGHLLDLNAPALGLFRLPLALAALGLFLGPLASYILRKRAQPHAATLALAAGAFTFLLAAHLALQTFAPVLTSEQLAQAIAPQLHADDLLVIHQEYEFASTLGFYLQRPSYSFYAPPVYPGGIAHPIPWPRVVEPIHILTSPDYNGIPNYGRSSNLWYGSFFPDAPAIFETPESLAARWPGPQRVFLWQDLSNQPSPLPPLPGPIYVIAQSGGKEIVSNQPDPATP